jgi:hypothetical protein
MATHRIPILGPNTLPDASGLCFWDNINNQLSMTYPKKSGCFVFKPPTSVDIGLDGDFEVPKNYNSGGTTRLIAIGVLDGAPSNTLGLTFEKAAIADSETFDVDRDAEETVAESTWTAYADEDVIELAITLTPGDYAVDDLVEFFFGRDFSAETASQYAGNFLLKRLDFEYTD